VKNIKRQPESVGHIKERGLKKQDTQKRANKERTLHHPTQGGFYGRTRSTRKRKGEGQTKKIPKGGRKLLFGKEPELQGKMR